MKINYKILTVGWAIFILLLSITPGNYIPPIQFQLISPDTIAHVLFYSVLIFLMLKWILPNQISTYSILFFTTISYGFVIEIIQGAIIPGRFFDSFDVLSNSIGAILGLMFFIIKNNKTQ